MDRSSGSVDNITMRPKKLFKSNSNDSEINESLHSVDCELHMRSLSYLDLSAGPDQNMVDSLKHENIHLTDRLHIANNEIDNLILEKKQLEKAIAHQNQQIATLKQICSSPKHNLRSNLLSSRRISRMTLADSSRFSTPDTNNHKEELNVSSQSHTLKCCADLQKKVDPSNTSNESNTLEAEAQEKLISCDCQNVSSHNIQSLHREIVRLTEQLSHSSLIITEYETKLSQAVSVIAEYDAKFRLSVTSMAGYETKIGLYTSQIEALFTELRKDKITEEKNTQTNHRLDLPLSVPELGLPSETSHPQSLSMAQHQMFLPKVTAAVKTPDKLASTQKQKEMESNQQHPSPAVAPACEPENPENPARVETQKKMQPNQHQLSPSVTSVSNPENHTGAQKHKKVQPESAHRCDGVKSSAQASNKHIEDENVKAKDSEQQPWVDVKKKQGRRPTSMCGTAGPAVTSLKAVEERKYIHLWNMVSGIEEIREYLRHLCPSATCTVHELKPRGDYKSYKIGVPLAHYDMLFSMDVWPINARMKAWVSYRIRDRTISSHMTTGGTTAKTNSPRPFRGRPSDGAAT